MKLAIVVAIAMALSGRARADDSKAAAREHVAAARSLHAEHRYAEALTELEAAYALDPTPALLFALGQVHVQLGRCDRAVGFYRRFLATRPKPDHAGVAREAIDACSHTSSTSYQTDVSVTAREPVRTEVSIKPSSVVLPPAPPPPPLPARHTRAVIGLGVVGAGAVIGSLVLYRGAVADRDRADAAGTYEEFEHFTERASGRQTGAIVSGVVGVAALTGGAILFAMRRHDAVRVTARGDGGAVSWSTRF